MNGTIVIGREKFGLIVRRARLLGQAEGYIEGHPEPNMDDGVLATSILTDMNDLLAEIGADPLKQDEWTRSKT